MLHYYQNILFWFYAWVLGIGYWIIWYWRRYTIFTQNVMVQLYAC